MANKMLKTNNNDIISKEVFKFPLNGNLDTNNNTMLSERIYYTVIRIRKKMIYGVQVSIVSFEIIMITINGLSPIAAIGLPITNVFRASIEIVQKPYVYDHFEFSVSEEKFTVHDISKTVCSYLNGEINSKDLESFERVLL